MYQNPKSATTAGLLGIFLGAFGAHNWYLGEKGKGIAHVCMMAGGLLVEIIAGAVLPNVLTFGALLTWASILGVLGGIAALAMSASGIWGLIEGITILAQGDAGLARKGYVVADPVSAPNYGQPMNGGYYNQPMNQPMNGNYGQQTMNNSYGPQPMPNNNMPENNMQNPGYGPNQPQNFNNMNGGANGQQ